MKHTCMLVVALILSALTPLPITAQSSLRMHSAAHAEVLVVGVYHMGNPGREVFNTEVTTCSRHGARRRLRT